MSYASNTGAIFVWRTRGTVDSCGKQLAGLGRGDVHWFWEDMFGHELEGDGGHNVCLRLRVHPGQPCNASTAEKLPLCLSRDISLNDGNNVGGGCKGGKTNAFKSYTYLRHKTAARITKKKNDKTQLRTLFYGSDFSQLRVRSGTALAGVFSSTAVCFLKD